MKKYILFFIILSFFNVNLPSEKSNMVPFEALLSEDKNEDIQIPEQHDRLLRSPTLCIITNPQKNELDTSGSSVDVIYKSNPTQ